MHKLLSPLFAAALIAALPALASAASLTTTANTTAAAATSTAAGTGLTSKSSFADLVSSLSVTSTTSAAAGSDIASIDAKSNVTVVLASKLTGYTSGGLKLSPAQTASQVKLDASVAANAALTAKVKKSGYLPSDVVAVSVDAKGNVYIFVAK